MTHKSYVFIEEGDFPPEDHIEHCCVWAELQEEEYYFSAMQQFAAKEDFLDELRRRGVNLDYCRSWSDQEIQDEIAFHRSSNI
jgi:hypothetical protein